MPAIGQSIHRIDARGKVIGHTLYPGDINLPDQLYMKVLFAGRPHAIIKKVDTEAAKTMPGVVAVLTAKDVPVNEYGLILPDQPVLCGPGSNKPFADRVRFIGDQVALVVGESEKIAAEALKRIEIQFEDLPVLTDPLLAMEDKTNLLHPENESNIFFHPRIRKGDIERGFQDAEVIVEEEYRTPAQEHAYLQPEAGVAYIDDEGRVTVEVAGQWTHEDREQIAHALDLPEEKVRIIYPAIGGAFGGREDMSVQIILALAAYRLHERGIDRPVKIIWSREESIIGHHKRHPFIIRAKWGATHDGKITAAQMELIQDGGAYAYTSTKVMGNAILMCTGPYNIPNVKVDTYSVYTNHIPGGAFRGFGGPQAAFAAEGQINKLAEQLSIDPVEIRMRNLLSEQDLLSVGTPLPKGVTLDQVVQACAEKAGWHSLEEGWAKPERASLGEPGSPYLRRGLGFACGFKNVGFSYGYQENATATVELHGSTTIEKVVLHHAGADVGQGAHTVMAQMAADAVGVAFEKVELIVSDTAETGNAGSTSASRMTFMSGHSIRGAAEAALQKWQDEERPAVATYTYLAPKTTALDPETGYCEPNIAYGYVAEAVVAEVDMETGHVHLVNVVCADEVGVAINPQQIEGQIEGAIVQASGYTILENFIQEGGDTVTRRLSTYLIPTVLDIPVRVDSLILENADPRGPWGARGMAEMPFIPLAPAVVAALKDAVGIWFDEFPLTPERVLFKIKEAGSIER
jgi:CO/xanthine dehydrogenase Mo-binding subunit